MDFRPVRTDSIISKRNREVVIRIDLGFKQGFAHQVDLCTATEYLDIVVFTPLPGNASLFIGLWEIEGVVPNEELSEAHRALITEFQFPSSWKDTSVFYRLKLNEELAELSERLVVDWGGAAVQWVQRQDKPVLEIRRLNSINDFVSYSEVKLSYFDLKKLVKDEKSNITWHRALSSVNGIWSLRYQFIFFEKAMDIFIAGPRRHPVFSKTLELFEVPGTDQVEKRKLLKSQFNILAQNARNHLDVIDANYASLKNSMG